VIGHTGAIAREKLGARARTHAVTQALKRGIISLDDAQADGAG